MAFGIALNEKDEKGQYKYGLIFRKNTLKIVEVKRNKDGKIKSMQGKGAYSIDTFRKTVERVLREFKHLRIK